MITIFRRVREKLVASGSVTKYLLYAIGEILLVVIGILIALQVNNWNENRIQKNEEIFYLQKLHQSITQDTATYNNVIELLNEAIDQVSVIENELYEADRQTFSVDITRTLLSTYHRPLERSTWDNLISTGKISLIRNNSVSESLFQYYYGYEENVQIWNQAHTHYTREIIAPFLMEFDDTSWEAFNIANDNFWGDVPAMMQKNIGEYRDEALFRNILRFKTSTMKSVKQTYIDNLQMAGSLMTLIEQELENSAE